MVGEKEKIKVLWFANTPCSASEKLTPGSYTGGWLSSLERELSQQDVIELAVVFYHHQNLEPFLHNKTKFFPILRSSKRSKFSRFFSRIIGSRSNDKGEIIKLLDIVQLVKPHIIHIHGSEENFGLIQDYTDLPVLISIQGILLPYKEKYFSGISKSEVKFFEPFKNRILGKSFLLSFKDLKARSSREKYILSRAKYIMGRTEWDRIISNLLSPSATYFIGQEVLRPGFYEKKWVNRHINDKVRIITVTSDGLYKGFELIVKTAQILLEYTSIKFEWTVVGVDNKSRIVKLVKKVCKVNPSDIGIYLKGRVGEHSIVQSMLQSDLFCQVSHIENSPNSLCEAMIVGMPIIATQVGGTATLIEDWNNGVLIQEGEPFILAGTIKCISNNYSLRSKLSNKANLVATERHDRQSVYRSYIETYNKIIDLHGQSSE